jgi:hypothetical protein
MAALKALEYIINPHRVVTPPAYDRKASLATLRDELQHALQSLAPRAHVSVSVADTPSGSHTYRLLVCPARRGTVEDILDAYERAAHKWRSRVEETVAEIIYSDGWLVSRS